MRIIQRLFIQILSLKYTKNAPSLKSCWQSIDFIVLWAFDMTLQIKNLTKVYGQQHAVNDISFTVGTGEIVGFLGPNGAGKSTTMKISTSYLPPTSGEVLVDGMNVADNPIGVKKITGYLPEHNPL